MDKAVNRPSFIVVNDYKIRYREFKSPIFNKFSVPLKFIKYKYGDKKFVKLVIQ